ncbi:MAG: cold shock domain-containing protein [Dechloromonas sp.]|nr:MAG: cold shock domain-containing protein [Dechloromonas sp.]
MDTRINGNLKTWDEARGFGFITPLNGGQDIFVHISDYPKRGGPPKVGEPISFEVALNKDGKKKATRVQRPGVESARQRRPDRTPVREGNSVFGRLIGFVVVAMIFAAGYKYVAPRFNTSQAAPAALASTPTTAPGRYQCDGRRYCSQMTSCEEATFFLKNCPGTEMDGDRDGVPCESQWCTSMFAK